MKREEVKLGMKLWHFDNCTAHKVVVVEIDPWEPANYVKVERCNSGRVHVAIFANLYATDEDCADAMEEHARDLKDWAEDVRDGREQ